MIRWKSFGASVVGPGHSITGKPNQDSWASFHHVWGDCIAISDGLGSKQFSDIGSHAACHAVEHAFFACRHQTDTDQVFLSNLITTNWLSRIAPLEAGDCAATCLFAFRIGDGVIRVGMLGDGLAAVLKVDGSVVWLSEDKSQGFSNITAALSPHTSSTEWQQLNLQEDECDAVLLCTDGVADDLENVDGFVKGYINAHRALGTQRANRKTRAMLENWPTPKHSDDKTIACLYREEVSDE